MTVDDKLITYLEDLSCLALTDDEKKRLKGDLNSILNSMAKLSELDTSGVDERSHPFDNTISFREDEVQASFDRELLLGNAPERNAEMFAAPKTV